MLSKQFLIDVLLKRDEVPSFEQYPFALDAVRNLESLRLHPAVTYLIGENGSGKSTLLEAMAIAWGFNPEGGSVNFAFDTHASHSELYKYLRLSRGVKRPRDGYFLRAESFFNVATEIQHLDAIPSMSARVIEAYGGKSLHKQSHGESFFALIQHRFRGQGLYMLDEPEAALSPSRQLSLLTRLHELVGMQSQFIIATHSPIVLAYPHATIYQLGAEGIREIQYDETEHVRMTREFMQRPGDYLDKFR